MSHHAPKSLPRPVLFVGGGNMAGAIIRAALKAGVLSSHATVVAEPLESRRRELSLLGVVTAPDAGAAMLALRHVEIGAHTPGAGAIVLAVKPQMLQEAVSSMTDLAASPPRLIVSILAGVTRERLSRALPTQHRITRVMPNLPISVGKGMTAIAESAAQGDEDRLWIERLFQSGGATVRLPEELMDAFTAVAGSGPAYLFYLAEAMERAAQAIGFDAPTARTLVRHTLVGAAALMSDDNADPAALRAAVTSKGGTTHAACTALDSAGVMEAFARAMAAARDRGRELSGS